MDQRKGEQLFNTGRRNCFVSGCYFSSNSEGNKIVMQTVLLLAVVAILGVNSLPAKDQIAPELIVAHIKAAITKREARSSTDDALKNLLDTTVRNVMLEGSTDWGIPVLDPLSLDHLDIDLNFDPIVLKGTLDGVKVTGISTFVVDSVKLNILGLNAQFAVHVPKIVVEADNYDIDGEIGGLVPVYGNGHLEVEVDGLYLSGKVQIGSNNSYVIVKSIDLDVNITALHTNIEGLLGGGDVSVLLNDVISDVAPDLLQDAKASILPMISEQVIKLANEKLVGVTVSDLLGLING
ncbi:hypothetical protein L9F63_022955 [Diploptera punctata]|uniref:Uncharacterized protein n=1 Tax=Diploptera punctata TaxID=6984 RepID=A0AAD7ZL58_DIPPU|nr:hypothetical protein L9F63_022955 [Diploptera punctata]